MSLHPDVFTSIPILTIQVARAAFPHGTALMRVRDAVGPIFSDVAFADLFPGTGQPAESPARLALVLIFQFMESLTDRQAADAVRSRIDWKYALGLELTDAGFDFSVLSEFRRRLIAGNAEMRIFDTVLTALRTQGLLVRRGRQRTDSTHVLQAVRDLNRLELVGETLRHFLDVCAEYAPAWIQAQVQADWYQRYARRFDMLHLPKSQAQRDALAIQIGHDGYQIIAAVTAETAPAPLRDLAAFTTLCTVWDQHFVREPHDTQVQIRWRKGTELAAAQSRVTSPFDTEARYCTHNHTEWKGYKVHFTETCDDDANIHLITHVETVLATSQDVEAPAMIHRALCQRDLLPAEHLMDAGYVGADVLVNARTRYDITIVGPITKDVSWQAREKTGYDIRAFTMDWDRQQVMCPHGVTSVRWTPRTDPTGNVVIGVGFPKDACDPCPDRKLCTRSRSQGRSMQIRPQAQHEAIQQTRTAQATEAFAKRYAKRMGIEGTISQAVRRGGARRTRYLGKAKTHLQMVAVASALNLARFAAYLEGTRPGTTRRSRFAALSA